MPDFPYYLYDASYFKLYKLVVGFSYIKELAEEADRLDRRTRY